MASELLIVVTALHKRCLSSSVAGAVGGFFCCAAAAVLRVPCLILVGEFFGVATFSLFPLGRVG